MNPHRNNNTRRTRQRPVGRVARGVTLIELLMALTITTTLSIVLGGLMLAVQAAREHTEGMEEATAQAQASLERVRYMVAHAGVYQLDGAETVLGLAVVGRAWSSSLLPSILVVWSGGRGGGMAEAGVQSRLPEVDEIVMYSYDESAPSRFVEIIVPGDSTEIDFKAADFDDTILSLISSASAEQLLLCDRLRRSTLSGSPPFSDPGVGNVSFGLEQLPDEASIAAVTPGTQAWNDLVWSQAIVSSDSGMRQATVRMEIQVEPYSFEAPSTDSIPIAAPFFGSASYRYVYRP